MENEKDINKEEERWIKELWRPAMAWQYLVVCLFDFLGAPILTGIYSFYAKIPYVPWEPITLKESALYHVAMGAVVGIAAWSRGNEKIQRWNMFNNGNSGSRDRDYRDRDDNNRDSYGPRES